MDSKAAVVLTVEAFVSHVSSRPNVIMASKTYILKTLHAVKKELTAVDALAIPVLCFVLMES